MNISKFQDRSRLVVVALVMVCFAIAPVFAEGRGQGSGGKSIDPEQRVQSQIDRLSKELSLSDEQREQVEPILLDAARQMGDLRREHGRRGDGGEGDRQATRETMQILQRETDSKLTAILDENQMERFRELRQQHRQEMRDRRQKQGGPPRNDA